MPYFLAPLIGWLTSGSLKFLINYIQHGKEARSRVGNGGFPSTHTTTLVTTAILIGWGEGWFSAAFGLAVAITYIVIIDATGVRMAVGHHAGVLNQLTREDASRKPLRESMGHTMVEILGGIVVGAVTGTVLFFLFQWLGWMSNGA